MRLLKFKRGTTPKNEIVGKAISLGLQIEPSFIGADCCFIKDWWISFGKVGSNTWNRL